MTQKRNFSDLRTRIASAVVMAAAALGTLYLGGTWFLLFWLSAALAVQWEWQVMIGPGARARTWIGCIGLALSASMASHFAFDYALVPLCAAAILCALCSRPGLRLWAAGGVVYAGALFLSVTAIRPPLGRVLESSLSPRAIIWLFAIVWGTDVGAYFGGRFLRGPKLWPRLSAGKTWSGAVVGALVGAGLGLCASLAPPPATDSIIAMVMVGLLASALSQAGDMFESAVKRRFGVKDSSRLIPGHGGVMDRLDGFIAASVFVVLLALARSSDTVAKGLFQW